MEQANSSTSSGNPGGVKDDSPSTTTPNCDRSTVEKKAEDTFQCTYFRGSSRRPPNEKGTTDDLTDISTDSESEVEDTVNVAQWMEAAPKNSRRCTVDDKLLSSGKKMVVVPKVRFDRKALVQSNVVPRSCPKKRSIKPEMDIVPVKRERLTKNEQDLKRNWTSKRVDHVKIPSRKKIEKSRKSSAFRKGIARNGRIQQIPRIVSSKEAILLKRRMAERRVARNKRLLRTVEEVIRAMNKNDRDRSFSSVLGHCQDRKPREDGVQTKVEEQRQGCRKMMNDRRMEIRRPIFRNPQIEQLLDRTMERAVKKYKTRMDTWKKLK